LNYFFIISSMKESLFFKREIAEKGLELLGVLGVD
jgi:hypothetical protein